MNDYPVFDISTVSTTSYDEKGFLIASVEVPGGQDAGIDGFDLKHPYGFISRPPDATQTDGCDLAFAYIGSMPVALALGDTRKTKLLAELAKGESMQYGPGGNFVRCKADGSISMCTSASGKLDSDAPTVFFDVRPNAFRLNAPWGRWWFDDTGYHAFTTAGAALDLGFIKIPGVPAPFDQLSSYADITAAMIRLKGTTVDLGNSPLTKDHLAHATPVLTLFGLVNATLTAVAATPPLSGNQAITAALTALTTAYGIFLGESTPPLTAPRMRSIVTAS